MGLFSKVLGSDNTPTTLSNEEAFVGILLAAIAADGHISNEEITDFNSFVQKSKTLQNVTGTAFNEMIDKLFRIFRREGLDQLVKLSADNLPEALRKGAFAMACDLLFSDGTIEHEEEGLLEKLKDLLCVDDSTATKIVEVMVIKNRV